MGSKVVLITGAGRGIGKELARIYAIEKAQVIMAVRNISHVKNALDGHLNEHKNVFVVEMDVSKTESVNNAFEIIKKNYSSIDVIVNNAGINYDDWQSGTNLDIDKTVLETFETNLFGAMRVVKTFLPLLLKSSSGRIVNVSSEAGAINCMGGGTPAYSTSKAALNAYTKILSSELHSKKILVNSVCPGWCHTDMGGSGGRPVELGAKSVKYACDLPDNGPTGFFFRDGQILEW